MLFWCLLGKHLRLKTHKTTKYLIRPDKYSGCAVVEEDNGGCVHSWLQPVMCSVVAAAMLSCTFSFDRNKWKTNECTSMYGAFKVAVTWLSTSISSHLWVFASFFSFLHCVSSSCPPPSPCPPVSCQLSFAAWPSPPVVCIHLSPSVTASNKLALESSDLSPLTKDHFSASSVSVGLLFTTFIQYGT